MDNLFEILIVIGIIVWSIYQNSLEKKKKAARKSDFSQTPDSDSDTASTSDLAEKEPQNLKEAFQILFGSHPEYPSVEAETVVPKPKPVGEKTIFPKRKRIIVDDNPDKDPFGYHLDTVTHHKHKPIHEKTLSKDKIKEFRYVIAHDVKFSEQTQTDIEVDSFLPEFDDPDDLKRFVVLKEILDKPKAMRP